MNTSSGSPGGKLSHAALVKASDKGAEFLLRHAIRPDGQVWFCLTADGLPVHLERSTPSLKKALAACSHILPLNYNIIMCVCEPGNPSPQCFYAKVKFTTPWLSWKVPARASEASNRSTPTLLVYCRSWQCVTSFEIAGRNFKGRLLRDASSEIAGPNSYLGS